MKTTLKAAATTLALAFAITTLAACAPTATTPTAPAKSKPAASAPAATPTAKPMSEFDRQVAAQTAPRDYVLPSGRSVVVDPKAPLPEVVVEAIAQGAAPIAAPLKGHQGIDARGATYAQLGAFADAQAALIGTGVVLVFPGSSVDGSAWGTLTSGGNHVTGLNAQASRTAMVADAQAYATTMGRALIVLG